MTRSGNREPIGMPVEPSRLTTGSTGTLPRRDALRLAAHAIQDIVLAWHGSWPVGCESQLEPYQVPDPNGGSAWQLKSIEETVGPLVADYLPGQDEAHLGVGALGHRQDFEPASLVWETGDLVLLSERRRAIVVRPENRNDFADLCGVTRQGNPVLSHRRPSCPDLTQIGGPFPAHPFPHPPTVYTGTGDVLHTGGHGHPGGPCRASSRTPGRARRRPDADLGGIHRPQKFPGARSRQARPRLGGSRYRLRPELHRAYARRRGRARGRRHPAGHESPAGRRRGGVYPRSLGRPGRAPERGFSAGGRGRAPPALESPPLDPDGRRAPAVGGASGRPHRRRAARAGGA